MSPMCAAKEAKAAGPRLFTVATEAALLLLGRLPGELTGSGRKQPYGAPPRVTRRFAPGTWFPGSNSARANTAGLNSAGTSTATLDRATTWRTSKGENPTVTKP